MNARSYLEAFTHIIKYNDLNLESRNSQSDAPSKQSISTGDRGITPLNQQYRVTSSPHTSAKNERERKRNPTNSSYTGLSLHIGGMWKRWCPHSLISLSKGHCEGISWHNHRATCRSPTAMPSSHRRAGWTRNLPKLKY